METRIHSRTLAATVDLTEASTAWRNAPPMAYGRYQHNLVVLSSGRRLAVGDANISATGAASSGVCSAELWSATSESWSTWPPCKTRGCPVRPRCCLPDGRVLAAGGGRLDRPRAFRPPRTPRRHISSTAPGQRSLNAPATCGSSGKPSQCRAPDAANIARVATRSDWAL